MKLTMLGTGHAFVTKCYNTCFVLTENDSHFLVDGGGGGTLFRQLKNANIDWEKIHNVFVTHKHIDHITGILWLVRKVCEYMSLDDYEGEVNIFAHSEVAQIICDVSNMLLQKNEAVFLGKRLHIIPVSDGQAVEIIGHRTNFFDIHSNKAKQYGFTMYLSQNDKLTCCGDEPYNESEKDFVLGSKWLLHEAFCLYSQADKFLPYEKHHSTVKDACQVAERLKVQNLLLYHTEDFNIDNRKKLYGDEGKKYFSGNLFIPDDLEVIEL